MTLVVLYVTTTDLRYELYTRTVSSVTTGWHYAAADIEREGGARFVFGNWPDFMESYRGISGHMMVSPPGMPMVYYAASQMFDRLPGLARWLSLPLRADQCHNYRIMGYSNAELASAWLGILMPLWGSLTVFPLYWLGQRIYSEGAGRRAALWWPLVPALLMFTPTPNTAYPLLSMTCVALLAEGLHRNKPLLIVLSGVMASALVIIAFTFLPLILLAGIFVLMTYMVTRTEERQSWHRPLLTGLWFGIGLLSLWVLYDVIFDLSIWTIFRTAMAIEHLRLERPYLPWLFFHLNDFFMFTGWPLVLLGGGAAWEAIQGLRRKAPLSMGQILTLSACLAVLILDLSGMGRGESGRVWLFFAPFILLAAASLLSPSDTGWLGWLTTLTQALMVLVLVTFVHVIGTELSEPPFPPPAPAKPLQASYLPSGAIFDDTLQLDSFAGQIEMLPGGGKTSQPTLVLWLNWQSMGQVERPYYLGIIPVTPSGEAIQATLIQPFDQTYPTTCWLPGSGLLQDRIEIPLDSHDPSGDWWVSFSLVNGQTGEKLDVLLLDGSRDDQVGIGPFRYVIE